MTIRVLHVLESLARGGIETTFLNVLRAWGDDPDMRHDVLAFRGGPLHDDYAAAADTLTVSASRAIIERAIARGCDVVHVLFDRCVLRLAPLLTARSDAALVVGKNYDVAALLRVNHGRGFAWDESALAAADAVTFTTPQLGAAYATGPVGDCAFTAGRAAMLRKAADVARFARLDPADGATPDRILCVANLHPRKRLADLAAVLRLVRVEVPTAHLHIAGSGSPAQQGALAAAAREHGVGGHVALLGDRRDVASELAQARVFALPSASEGVPTVLLEAMAAARPVVAASSGHLDHIVEQGVEGFVTRPGDIEAMAGAIIRLLSDRELAGRMGAAGRRRAAAHDVAIVAAQIAEVLRSAARPRRRAA